MRSADEASCETVVKVCVVVKCFFTDCMGREDRVVEFRARNGAPKLDGMISGAFFSKNVCSASMKVSGLTKLVVIPKMMVACNGGDGWIGQGKAVAARNHPGIQHVGHANIIRSTPPLQSLAFCDHAMLHYVK